MSVRAAHPMTGIARSKISVRAAMPSIGSARGSMRHTALLAGVSAAALFMAAPDVLAKPMGGWTATPSSAAMAAAQSGSQDAARAARDGANALKRATLAIQAMQATQAAAREAARLQLNAMPNMVPNGLRPGGLQIGTGVIGAGGSVNPNLWQGAKLPAESADGDRTKIGIEQTQQKAILTWDTFNVGGKTDLTFDQMGNANWVALNRVLGTDAKPSQILGNIKADGQVYIINQNGIIFGGASQVNVGALIASTAKITNEQFLSGIYSAQSGSSYLPSFTNAAALLGNGTGGGVVKVEAGAQIAAHAPASVTSGGGFVLLMGGEVYNAGSISTPLGQTQLAAGDDFVLRRGYGTDNNSFSTTRGNEIAVGSWDGTTFTLGSPGRVANNGIIVSSQGDITMAGRTVEQNGILVASTSVNNRGTIHLLNAMTDALGSVTLGSNSVTTIIPELDSDETALNSQRDALIKASDAANAARNPSALGVFNNLSLLADRLDQSRVEIVTGGDIVFRAESLTIAQGGQVAVSAGHRIFTEGGATIDVSGVRDVVLAMSTNNLMVNIQGNELRDSPQNRDQSYLKNANVWVDIRDLIFVPKGTGGYDSDRYYTPGGLLEVGGYLANTAHRIGEWSAVGGTITLSAPEVIAQKDSVFDISGGSIHYEAGNIVTTNFLGPDGRLYNISNARADMTFYGLGEGFIRKNERWGITEVWTSPLGRGRETVRWEDGYTVGRDAGKLVLSTPTSIFEGKILADVVQGQSQINARPANVTDGYKLSQNTVPLAGTFALANFNTVERGSIIVGVDSPVATKVTIGDGPAASDRVGLDDAVASDLIGTINLDAASLSSFGLGGLTVEAKDTVRIAAPLRLSNGGHFKAVAPTIDIAAVVTARSGTVTLANVTDIGATYLDTSGGSSITLRSGATIDARGLWTNALLDPSNLSGLAFIEGGSVTLRSTGDVTLEERSLIDVSSGAALLRNGSLQGGHGGNITLAAGSYVPGDLASRASGILTLKGEMRAYGVQGGGTLTIEAARGIVIGGSLSTDGGVLVAGNAALTNLLLSGGGYDIATGDVIPLDVQITVDRMRSGQTFRTDVVPLVSVTNPVITAADWTLGNPQFAIGIDSSGNTVTYSLFTGSVVPAGTKLIQIGTIYASLPNGALPGDVFPDGIPITPATAYLAAGTVASQPIHLDQGSLIPAGSILPRNVTVERTSSLATNLFQQGFSHYAIGSQSGIVVAKGATVDVTMPVYRAAAGSSSMPTGADPAAALELWMPPLYQENPVAAALTQRLGASISFTGGSPVPASPPAPILIGEGAAIKVDPGQTIDLTSNAGQITIEGTLTAPGGTISIVTLGQNYFNTDLNRSIWIGETARLDVAGRTYIAHDRLGRAYGVAPDGGSIEIGLSDAHIVVRPGAVLDASGAPAATIDLAAGTRGLSEPITIAGNGGEIALRSYNGMFLDGALRAGAGGYGASGGSLTLDMDNRVYETASRDDQILHRITLTQRWMRSGLSDNLLPGQADGALQLGNAALSVEQVKAGGFDSLTLSPHDLLVFDGDVNLVLGRSLSLGGVLLPATSAPDAKVVLSAPIIELTGGSWQPPAGSSIYIPGLVSPRSAEGVSGASSLTLSADLIEIRREVLSGVVARLNQAGPNVPDHWVSMPSFTDVALNSSGDVRMDNGSLITSGDLHITASQIYPLSGKKGALIAGLLTPANFFSNPIIDPDRKLVIQGLGGRVPEQPYSVFGHLLLIGGTVDQGGIVRAPLGTISINTANNLFGTSYLYLPAWNLPASIPTGGSTILRAGSITSVSAAGLVIPYGGTTDGLTYRGTDGTFYDIGETSVLRPNEGFNDSNSSDSNVLPQGIDIAGRSLTTERGSVLDLSGGGALLGAGFVSGRGGSVDILTTPLVNANPAAYAYSQAGNHVYAVLPGYASAYAPTIGVNKDAGAAPLGQQITINTAVGGLPAGTYTLLPASFAMMPGAFRIEVGAKTTMPIQNIQRGAGTWLATGLLSIAGTGIRDAVPSRILVTSGQNVRRYSQYNETGYAQFAAQQASQFGKIAPRLPSDGKILRIAFVQDDTLQPLTMDGTALMSPAEGGFAGQLVVTGNKPIEISAAQAASTPGMISLGAEALNAFDAGTLMIGGWSTYFDGKSSLGDGARIYFTTFGSPGDSVTVRAGVTLAAGQIFLIGNQIKVEGGAVLDTRGSERRILDSSLGYIYANSLRPGQDFDTPAVLSVANGWLNFLDAKGSGSITVEDGASLLTRGTVAFVAPGSLKLGDVRLGASYLTVSQDQINVGSDAALAAAATAGVLPDGWQLDQRILDLLLRPADPTTPALRRLSLTAGGAFNFFGSVALDAKASATELVFNAPAFYGLGDETDTVRITADTFVWNGLARGSGTEGSPYTSAPPAALIAGGPGYGSGRLVINANVVEFGYDALSRAQTQATLDRLVLGFSAVDISAANRITANSKGSLSIAQTQDAGGELRGGNLSLTTPLLTGKGGAQMSYQAGGALDLAAPAGAGLLNAANISDLGSAIILKGESVRLDTAIVLPSGQLTVTAGQDITLGDHALIDLAGREITFFDVRKYSWGGALVLNSAAGYVRQAPGAVIDVSAAHNNAGSIFITAGSGVDLAGSLHGTGGGSSFQNGRFGLDVGSIASADFAALNDKLNQADFDAARSFRIRTGDLTVGEGVHANEVEITIEAGSLTVNGKIDASGRGGGSIRLSARDNLTLASGAVLDAHGRELVTDSYGAEIDASNQPRVELTSVAGSITLEPFTTIDLTSADGAARGKLEINAPRLGGAADSGAGANDIAVNASGTIDIRGAASIAANAFRRYQLADGSVIDQIYLNGVHSDSTDFIDAALANPGLSFKLAGLMRYGKAFHLRPGVEIWSTGSLSTKGDLDLSGYRYGPDANLGPRGSGEVGVLTVRAGGGLTINGSINDGFAPPPDTPDDNGWVITQKLLLGGQEAPQDIDFLAPYNPVWGSNYYLFPSANTGDDYPVVVSGQVVDDERTYNPGDTIYGYLAGNVHIAVGTVLSTRDPKNSQIVLNDQRPEPGRMWAIAPMLAPGSQSWSMRLVAGADVGAVDSRTLMPKNSLASGQGDLVLSDLHYAGAGTNLLSEAISVVRTGTGDLELFAGGSYRQDSPFGVYTAGTAITESVSAPYNLQRARTPDGSILGLSNSAFEATLNDQRMWFTTGGGNLRLSVQGNITGYKQSDGSGSYRTDTIGDWLWRQGGSGLGQQTAWGINFGSYVLDGVLNETDQIRLAGFSGIGALGGGNAIVKAGGDIGIARDIRSGITVAVAGSGRIENGALVQTGGGGISIVAGGTVYGGLYSALRGDTSVTAANVGQMNPISYGSVFNDPRALDPLTAYAALSYSGVNFAPGDGAITVETLGDLVLGDVIDPGRVGVRVETQASANTTNGVKSGSASSWFTLWTGRTAIDLVSAGGNLSPFGSYPNVSESTTFMPSSLSAVAAGGNIYYSGVNATLVPSPHGQLELLASGLISGLAANTINNTTGDLVLLGTSTSTMATPLRPGWRLKDPARQDASYVAPLATNYWGSLSGSSDAVDNTVLYQYSGAYSSPFGIGGALFMFGPNTITDGSAASEGVVSHIYARDGDILGLRFGVTARVGDIYQGTNTTYYQSSKPVRIRAEGDIVNSSGLIVQYAATDVSTIVAGGSIIYTNFSVAGPGTLEVNAGHSLYQGDVGSLASLGAIAIGDNRPGASIVMTAGVGASGPDYADFAMRYLDPSNLAISGTPLADQRGKVAKTYENELYSWLKQRFTAGENYVSDGRSFVFTGTKEQALAFFLALPLEQQAIFLRTVYFAELKAGGREYNNPDSQRYGSYLRGRDAIATLFPDTDASGNPIGYAGDITMFGGSGIRTLFGGDIQLLAPGGQTVLGVEGPSPPSTAGLITQGSGDIQLYSRDSILLGQSRIMTTFGGGILAWSARGDINAGRGAKTTIIYTPPKRVTDNYGNVSLSPQAPSSGAGISSRSSVPGVPGGDVDLIAPLGTIDAGEAGIRSGANVNLAALQIVNAANIQAQGKVTGVPEIKAPNIAGLTQASNTAGAAAAQAGTPQQGSGNAQPSIIIVEVLGFGGGDNGGGVPPEVPRKDHRQGQFNQDPDSTVRVIGNGPIDLNQARVLTEAEKQQLAAGERRKM